MKTLFEEVLEANEVTAVEFSEADEHSMELLVRDIADVKEAIETAEQVSHSLESLIAVLENTETVNKDTGLLAQLALETALSSIGQDAPVLFSTESLDAEVSLESIVKKAKEVLAKIWKGIKDFFGKIIGFFKRLFSSQERQYSKLEKEAEEFSERVKDLPYEAGSTESIGKPTEDIIKLSSDQAQYLTNSADELLSVEELTNIVDVLKSYSDDVEFFTDDMGKSLANIIREMEEISRQDVDTLVTNVYGDKTFDSSITAFHLDTWIDRFRRWGFTDASDPKFYPKNDSGNPSPRAVLQSPIVIGRRTIIVELYGRKVDDLEAYRNALLTKLRVTTPLLDEKRSRSNSVVQILDKGDISERLELLKSYIDFIQRVDSKERLKTLEKTVTHINKTGDVLVERVEKYFGEYGNYVSRKVIPFIKVLLATHMASYEPWLSTQTLTVNVVSAQMAFIKASLDSLEGK